jgi:hypothetical protein
VEIQSEFHHDNIRGGGWLEIEGTRWCPGEPIPVLPALVVNTGPTLEEVTRRRVEHGRVGHMHPDGSITTYPTELQKDKTVLRLKNPWFNRLLSPTEAARRREQVAASEKIQFKQETPEGYSRKELSNLRAYRLARFLTYNSPKLAGTYLHGVEVNAIKERGFKTRVVSSHPAYVTHYSRCVSRHLLPVLKDSLVSRDSLRNLTIELKNKSDQAVLYSADLTAASDWIDHTVGQAALKGILEGLGVQHAEIESALRCLEPYRINNEGKYKDRITTRGAHMGLGTTWTVLSILNFFAARAAGAPIGSFKICGDDLIGLWTRKQIAFYEEAIEDLGLKLNKTKSFIGPRGVFCEKLIEITRQFRGRQTVAEQVPVPQPTLKECWPEKERCDPQQVSQLRQLSNTKTVFKPVRELCSQAIRRASRALSNLPMGPVAYGGRGEGKINPLHVKSKLKTFLIRGPFSIRRDVGSSALKDRTEIYRFERTTNPAHGRTPYEDVLVSEMMADREKNVVNMFKDLKDRFQETYEDEMAPPSRALTQRWKEYERAKAGKPLSKFTHRDSLKVWQAGTRGITMIEAIRGSRFINARTRYRLLKIEQNSKLRNNSALWQSKIERIAKRTPVQYVPTNVLLQHPVANNMVQQNGRALVPRWERESDLSQ